MGRKRSAKSPPASFSTKKCPYCQTHLPLAAETCTNCKKSVGPLERHGAARKKTDWKAYTICIAAWTFFFIYIWWAFLR